MKLRLPFRSLRYRILAWSFIPTALALVGVGLVSFIAFQRTTRTLLIERNREVAHLTAVQLAGELEEYPLILEGVANSAGIDSIDPAVRRIALDRLQNRLVAFDGGVVVTDQHGVVVASVPRNAQLEGQNWSDRAYFRQMIRSSSPIFSDIVTETGSGSSIVISVPIIGQRDEFLGIIAGRFVLGSTNISQFYGSIVKLRLGETDRNHLNTYLVDGTGKVIFHTDNRWIGADFSTREGVQHFLAGNYIDDFNRGQPAKNTGSRVGALRSEDLLGREVVVYYSPVPGAAWGLISEADWTGLLDFYRPYLLLQTGLFVLGVLLPAVFVGYRIRRITEPVYQLKDAAGLVAAGSLGHTINVDTHDELEELVDQFNVMSLQLQRSYATIVEREERLALVMQGANDGIWDWNIVTGEIYFSPRWKNMLGYAEDEIAGKYVEWQRLIHPEDEAAVATALESHFISSDRLYQQELRIRHRDGSYRHVHSRGITLRDADGHPLRMVGSISDITERKNAETALFKSHETLEERVRERTRDLTTLNEISSLINRPLDMETILGEVLEVAAKILDYDFGAVYRLEGDQPDVWLTGDLDLQQYSHYLYLKPLSFWQPDEGVRSGGSRFPFTDSIFETAWQQKPPDLITVDLARLDVPIMSPQLVCGQYQVIVLPLDVKGRALGAVLFGTCSDRKLSQEEIDVLTSISRQVGGVLENNRLHEMERQQWRQTATLEERARLARELHDSVTQSLYSITLLGEAIARLLASGDQQKAIEHLRVLRDSARDSLREMRLLIFELRPVPLEQINLMDALRNRVEAVEARSGIKTEMCVEGVECLPYPTKLELYYIAQEALNNVLKHSAAEKVTVSLHCEEALACLVVSDDGRGFDPQRTVGSGGLGLAGMVERAGKIGAELEIDSAPGCGARIIVTVPL